MITDPGDELVKKAAHLLRLRRPRAALDMTSSALAIDPGNPEAHYLHGVALVHLERPHEAIVHLEQAIAAVPWFDDAYRFKGVALDQAGKTKSARRSVERALDLAPESVPSLLLAAEMDLQLRQRARARSSVQRALSLASHDPEVHVVAALVELRSRNAEQARWHLNMALQLDPASADALDMLGIVVDADDDLDRALELWKRSAQIDARGRGAELYRRGSRRRHRIRQRVRRRRRTVWITCSMVFVLTGAVGVGRLADRPDGEPVGVTPPNPTEAPALGAWGLVTTPVCEPLPGCVSEWLDASTSVPLPASTTTSPTSD